MLLNVQMNEFILVLWKRRGWWLLGGCWCEWLSCEAFWDAALTSVCPNSRSTTGSVCGSAYTALPDCPGWMQELQTDGLSKERDEQCVQTPGWGFRAQFGHMVPAGAACIRTRTEILFISAVCWGFSLFYDVATITYLRQLCSVRATDHTSAHGSLKGIVV